MVLNKVLSKKCLLRVGFFLSILVLISFKREIYAEKYYQIDDIKNTVGYSVTKDIEPKLLLPNIKEVIDRGYLKVVMVPNNVDVFFRVTDDNKILGLDVNLAKQIASLLGVKLRIYPIEKYTDIVSWLSQKKVDLAISMYSLNAYRSASINFSDPYLSSNLCITANGKTLAKYNIKNNPIDYMKENPVKIGVFHDTVHVMTVKNAFPKAEIIEKETQADLVEAILNEEIFAMFQGEVETLDNYIARPKLRVYAKSFLFSDAIDRFCVALPADNLDMLNIINTYILSHQPLSINDVETALKEFYNY